MIVLPRRCSPYPFRCRVIPGPGPAWRSRSAQPDPRDGSVGYASKTNQRSGKKIANFWTNGNNSADLVSVNNKSSVVTWETATNISVGISDPTQTNNNSITVTLNRSAASVTSADSGVTVLQLSPQIIFSVNVNGAHGKTFQASFLFSSLAPAVAIVAPATNTVYLNSTNLTLLLSATASNPVPANAMTTVWNQTSGTGNFHSAIPTRLRQPRISAPMAPTVLPSPPATARSAARA